MELKDYRYFCATAELEHVTKAADKLCITQPYLTRVIHQIEDEVGGELFDKSGRRIKLNANGKVFYKYAKRVLADIDILNNEMEYLFDRKERTITLLCNTESFSTRLIHDFNCKSPDFSVSILQTNSDEMIPSIIDGRAQFSISSPPLPTKGISDVIVSEKVFGVVGCLLLPPGHPLLAKSAVDIDDLRNEKLVTMPKGSGMRNRLQSLFDEYHFYPKILCESDNLSVIVQTVMSGFGYAFVTKLIMLDYPELWKYVRKINVPDVVGYYGICYDKFSIKGRNEAAFLDFLHEFFDDLNRQLEETGDKMFECSD